jgi:hypothetical protein
MEAYAFMETMMNLICYALDVKFLEKNATGDRTYRTSTGIVFRPSFLAAADRRSSKQQNRKSSFNRRLTNIAEAR